MTLLKSKLTALLAALAFAGSVGATTYSAAPSLITGTGAFSSSVGAGAFDDWVHFSVGPNGGASWSASATNFTGVSGLGSLISALYAGTWSSASGLPAPVAMGASGSTPIFPGFSVWATAGGVAGPLSGPYTLRVSGAAESMGGSYAGTIALAPVPEPGEWALMLSGIGLIGLMVRRRLSNRG